MPYSGQTFDRDIFEEMRSIMKAKFPILLEGYFEDANTYIGQIKKSLVEGDPETIAQSAHPLKSSSKQIGAMMMAELALQIESMSRAIKDGEIRDLEDITIPLVQLEASFAKTRTTIEELLNQ